MINNEHYSLEIRAIIADAPAKSFIKQIKNHGGYYACDRCHIKGIYNLNTKSVSYYGFNKAHRTDMSFRNRDQH